MLRLFLIVLSISSAHAFRFSPMSVEINLSEKRDALVYVENDTTASIALETSIYHREMNVDGTETASVKDASELIALYPPQFILHPGQKRSIKLSWLGDATVSQESAYRLKVEQLPLELDKTKKNAGIKVLLKYLGAVYVDNGRSEAKLAVVSAIIDQNSKQVQIRIKNEGKKHKILEDIKLTYQFSGKEKLIKGQEVNGLYGENVLGQSERLFKFKIPAELEKIKDLQVKVEIK